VCNNAGNVVGVAPVCACAIGYVQIGSSCLSKLPPIITPTGCNSNCTTCLDTTNQLCPVCASDAYHFGNGLCLSSCPYGFMEDSQYHLCFFDVEALT
jgi:hypothetical protein